MNYNQLFAVVAGARTGTWSRSSRPGATAGAGFH
jgi:hypothetical protein